MFKKLFRRETNFHKDNNEYDVTAGHSFTVTFENPGWLAFDFMADTTNPSSGKLTKATFVAEVSGNPTTKFTARASWAWTRHYIWVDEGKHTFNFSTQNYTGSDYAKIRHIRGTNFEEVKEISIIEKARLPMPKEDMNVLNILNGWTRYQGSGNVGTEIEFTCAIKGTDNYRKFLGGIENWYILKGDEGLYGGTILMQSIEQQKKGYDLYLVTCTLHSTSRAGRGHW